ncbi:ATP-binding protein [Acetobacter senegalensis]|uniref:AAA family ATPase n=1 Tax=Acetobacter senegalensis TaxID=446692 RepID=UPI001EDAAED9|nr:AAA family ATPase [Acetobacter senegalensis]MCG4254103.1 ATP-binding protein [Acetobacter senegalensis]
METTTLFSRMVISGWRQFREIEIDFHDRLTILTGSNGAGKSTILQILKCHFPYESDGKFLSTPVKENNRTKFLFGEWIATKFDKLFPRKVILDAKYVGQIDYSNQKSSYLQLPPNESMQYALQRSERINVAGISISSHRVLPRYEQIKHLSISGISPQDAYKDFFDIQKSYNEQSHYFRDGVNRSINPVAALKEAIISFATFGVGNAYVAPIPELVGLYEKFQDILARVLPEEVGFERLEIRTPEVVIVSSSGEFPIDGASGGLMSIIQLSWQIFLQSQIYGNERYMVLIDEPENHLHPSMQRSFLANIVEAFPFARFVVATHSPFIISSVKDSHVYALRHHTSDGNSLRPLEPRSVISDKLDQLKRAGPANDILREVLGVPVTIPEWSATQLESISEAFANQKVDANTLENLRKELRSIGLEEFYPDAVRRIIK